MRRKYLAEEALGQISVLVDRGVKGAPLSGRGAARDDGFCSSRRDCIHGTLAIVTFVGEHMICGHPFEQGLDLRNVVALAAGQDEADRIAQRIGGDMNLCAQPAFGAAQRVSFKSIFGSIAFFGAPALADGHAR